MNRHGKYKEDLRVKYFTASYKYCKTLEHRITDTVLKNCMKNYGLHLMFYYVCADIHFHYSLENIVVNMSSFIWSVPQYTL